MSEAASVQAHLMINGRVQRVFFRETMKQQADAQRISGWVRNNPDGTVEAVLQGPRQSVEALIAWAHDGPPRAQVDSLDIRWETIDELLSEFLVAR